MGYAEHLIIVWGFILVMGILAAVVIGYGYMKDSVPAMSIGLGIGFLLIVGALALNIVTYKASASTAQVHVTDKLRSVDSDGRSARYLIYTDSETFEDTDALISFHKTDSSDLFGRLHPGTTYTCTAAGWRVHLFSEYRNLISCK